MNPQILITGASGTVGRAVVAALEARKMDFSIMRSKPGTAAEKHPVVVGDYGSPESLRQAFSGFDIVFVVQPLVPKMVEHGKNIVAAAKAAGVRHIVRSSGAGADPDSAFSIAKAHGEIDQAITQSGLRWTLLRPNFYMQNHLNFNAGQIQSGTYYAAQGDGAISMINVDDIGESVAAVLAAPETHAGKTYTLTGPAALSNTEQMAIIGAAIGHPVAYVDIPPEAAEKAMTDMGMPAQVIAWLLSLHAVVKAGYAGGLSPDVETLTGHPPRQFADFVQAKLNAWK